MANHPIFARAFHGDIDAVRTLLDQDQALVSIRNAKNLTPLHVAASRGQHRIVQLLLAYGADVNGLSLDGTWTPIVFAAYRGHLDTVSILIENGAGIRSSEGNPIHYAGQRKHKDICRLLVQHGAVDDRLTTTDIDFLQLYRAANSYDFNGANQILSRRPEISDFQDIEGQTPLHAACRNGDIRTVRILLKHGADAAVRDRNKQRPIDQALAHRQHAVVKLLEKQENAA